MQKILFTITFLLIISIHRSEQQGQNVIHTLFGDRDKTDVVYYGYVDLDKSEYTILNTLNTDDVGNPRQRKYQILPLTYDPTNDIAFMAAVNNQNRTILSVLNATTGALLRTFNSIPNGIISLQYDIFNKKLFAHTETNVDNVTHIVEIDTNAGSFKQILGEISGAKPTDICSYCPICRKYFFVMIENDHFTYLAVNTTDGGGISWRVPINFAPLNIRFTYKTFIMYAAFVNQTDRITSQIGILDRTTGSISKVVGTISSRENLLATRFSAFDIATSTYYISDVMRIPFSRGISSLNVNTSETKRVTLPENNYNFYAWFIKQFVQ
ncbi:unnamed protein product [Rotaria magnacalcarata]|uniref:Uncharacterized protein n=4 Tax=Rotaria magnacalcarata TaxID=392030 RepID=A0A819QYI4_9BILA|nr:unnamed protein product [Rotaria magnacalcarata]CAF1258041.1 unnamed protein product [Rotaria magnacalcarata]CAF2050158.1 unnamed protein product [Rotaria magnacalcarata]CAF2064075.1 unnamed protein product [Rotaria magnacalcarata]CAF3833014.1 unnamed protein product [Rotaria magnacalcarata]